jgi:hypothetical protein
MTILQVLAGILAALMLFAAAAGSGPVTVQAAPGLADASITARVNLQTASPTWVGQQTSAQLASLISGIPRFPGEHKE